MDSATLTILCAAAALSAMAYFVMRLALGGSDESKLRDRLTGNSKTAKSLGTMTASGKGGALSLFQRLGQAAAEPFMPKSREKQSRMRHSLGRAGIYSPSAFRVMTGFKVILLGTGLVGGYFLGTLLDNLLLYWPLGGIAGYLAPQLWLRSKINANQRALTHGLADALDLMVVCVEAGLTVDAAMQRVGGEMGLAHPAIAREFGIAHMETRVGVSRADALRNMAQRTGCAGIQSLVAMLVQADRFGTSIAQALRVHAETLRTTRQNLAEELAAKASVKISFPLVLFIFPSTFIVLCGPVILDLMNSDLFK
jgi:tight adherence protein C